MDLNRRTKIIFLLVFLSMKVKNLWKQKIKLWWTFYVSQRLFPILQWIINSDLIDECMITFWKSYRQHIKYINSIYSNHISKISCLIQLYRLKSIRAGLYLNRSWFDTIKKLGRNCPIPSLIIFKYRKVWRSTFGNRREKGKELVGRINSVERKVKEPRTTGLSRVES